MSLNKLIGIALSLVLYSGSTVHAQNFVCPVPQVTETQAAAISKVLPNLEAFRDNAKIAAAIEALKNDADGTVQVVNGLIAAYCPLVLKEQGVTDAEKTADVSRFGLSVTRQAFVISSEEKVILDVALAPELVEKITAKAKAQGISAEEWVAAQISAALAQ